jgi:predicted RecA/RadA family phage recombinase
MKNFVQPGAQVRVTAPYNTAAGQGVLVGSLFGIAADAALSTEEVEIVTEGVFDIAKAASQAWTVGARIYWDDSARVATTAAAAGANKLIGVAMAAVGSGAGETIGRVRLSAAFTL